MTEEPIPMPSAELIEKAILHVRRVISRNMAEQGFPQEKIDDAINGCPERIKAKAIEDATHRLKMAQVNPRHFAIEININGNMMMAAVVDIELRTTKTIETQYNPAKRDECFEVVKEVAGSYIRNLLHGEIEYAPDCSCAQGYLKDPESAAVRLCPNQACQDYAAKTFNIEDIHPAEVTIRSPRDIEIFTL